MRFARGLAVLVVAMTLVGAGWVAARRFESPAQREAQAKPPPPAPIYEAVTQGRLANVVTAQAQVASQTVNGLALQAVPDHAVVTAAGLAVGATVAAGSLLLVVNGRPVFAFAGRFSFYRDLTEGEAGPDVEQLQTGLLAAGLAVPTAELGRFGPATARAVTQLYHRAGFATPSVTPADAPVATDPSTTPSTAATTLPAPTLVTVPLTEIVTVPSLPAVLQSISGVGAVPAAGRNFATVRQGDLVVRAAVANSAAATMAVGMAASFSMAGGASVAGHIATIDSSAANADGTTAVTLVGQRPLPAAWQGQSVLATIVVSLISRGALLVPSRAMVTDGGGHTAVFVRRHRNPVRCPVRVLGSLAGQSAVAPVVAGGLVAGDQVEIG